ncbi:unnamed protein product [Strongylus vulgaris]|uniref:Uncharacterized protein n=1 Tax=Strongylus vulgaris TaxID=40348 RepID=A0A3P7LRD8_STRVU|nr:unnamed protein product [Strongylus vulgaris]
MALATTMIRHGFMIQKTKSPKETAQFLCRVTEHLKATIPTRQVRCFYQTDTKIIIIHIAITYIVVCNQ